MEKGEEPVKKVVNGTTVVPSTNENFIRAWLEVMRPLHKMTPKEMDYVAILLEKRAIIANEVNDQGMIDKLLFDEETKEIVRKKAKVSSSHAKVILYNLKKKGVIKGKRMNPMYIPIWEKGKPFRWMFVFKNES